MPSTRRNAPAAIGMIVATVSKGSLANDVPALPYVLFCVSTS